MSKQYKAYINCKASLVTEDSSLDKKTVEKLISNTKNLKGEAKIKLEHPNALMVDCVQASTFYNDNDHYFVPQRLWDAKSTSVYQVADWMHDPEQAIGCISESVAKTQAGKLMEEDAEITDETAFDVHNKIVVWANYFPEYAEKIVELYEDNKLFVSMECLFSEYDFAIQDQNGQVALVERNEETDFLTEHLKIFGGKGVVDGYRIGIAFKDFVFSGVAFVDRNISAPANKRSDVTNVGAERQPVIDITKFFEENEKKSVSNKKSGVTKSAATNSDKNEENSSKKGDIDMELEDLYKESKAEAKEAQAKAVELEKENKELAKKLEAAEAETVKIREEWTSVSERVQTIEDESTHMQEQYAKEKEEASAKIKELEEKVEATEAEKKELAEKLEEIEVARKNEARKEAVAALDVEIEDEKLFAMSEEAFEVLTQVAKKKEDKKEDKKDEEDDMEGKATEELEKAKEEEQGATATVENDEDEDQDKAVRGAIATLLK